MRAATLGAAQGIKAVRRVRRWKVAVVVIPEAFEGPVIFTAVLRRWPGTGGWVFAPVPDEHAPGRAGAFGRVPVTATVDGHSWPTSVWRDRTHGWLLAVPAKVRRGKDDGDTVSVQIELDHRRL